LRTHQTKAKKKKERKNKKDGGVHVDLSGIVAKEQRMREGKDRKKRLRGKKRIDGAKENKS